MASQVDKLKSSVTGKVESTIKDVLGDPTIKNNVSTCTFPANLENQAQSTYMAIYIFDDKNNKEKFTPALFDTSVDEGSWEIGAVTWLKEEAKSLETSINKELQRVKDNIVKTGKEYLQSFKDTIIDDTVEYLGIDKNDARSAWDWTKKWVIPHRKVSKSKALYDTLDPTKHPYAGYELVQAIHIQMPSSNITYKYENGWESTDTNTLNNIRNLISGLTSMFGDKDARKAGKQKLDNLLVLLGNAVGDVVTGGGYSADRMSNRRQVANPVIVFNYTVPTPRTFSYRFQLYPRNREELYTLYNMIQMLKFYALPTVNGAKSDKNYGSGTRPTFYNYPAKFAIKFFTNGYENKWFPKTMSLGLTSIEESLTGEGGDMAFFENYFDKESGNPPRMVDLQLNFKELGIMHREYAKEGY